MSKKLSLSRGTSQSSCMDWLPIYDEFRLISIKGLPGLEEE